jgi:hypothetical protein
MASYEPGTAGSSAVSVRLIARFQWKYQAFRDQPLCCEMLCEAAPSEHAGARSNGRGAPGIEGEALRSSKPSSPTAGSLSLLPPAPEGCAPSPSVGLVGKGPRSARSRDGRSTHHPFGPDAGDSGFDVASPELDFRLSGINYVNSHYCERLECMRNSLKLRLNKIFHNIPYANRRYRAPGFRLPPVLGFPP